MKHYDKLRRSIATSLMFRLMYHPQQMPPTITRMLCIKCCTTFCCIPNRQCPSHIQRCSLPGRFRYLSLQSITDLFDPLDLGDNPSRLISGSTNENTIISMQQSRQGLTYLWPNFLLLQLEDVAMYRDLSFAPVVAELNKEELVSAT